MDTRLWEKILPWAYLPWKKSERGEVLGYSVKCGKNPGERLTFPGVCGTIFLQISCRYSPDSWPGRFCPAAWGATIGVFFGRSDSRFSLLLYLYLGGAGYESIEEKIVKEGVWLPGNILKVGSFLNHQIDGKFMMELGEEIARLFAQEKIDRILTIETSGIPLAMAASVALGVPMVFAKKNRTSNLSGGLYQTVVHSYTHNTDYTVVVEKQYLPAGERGALRWMISWPTAGPSWGLMELVNQAVPDGGRGGGHRKGLPEGRRPAPVPGPAGGGSGLIDSMDNGNLVFRR